MVYGLSTVSWATQAYYYVHCRHQTHKTTVCRKAVCLAGKFAEACQSYIRALEIKAETPSIWDSLSMAFIAMGQFPLADLADKHDLAGLTSKPLAI